jgi:hypothetical protein
MAIFGNILLALATLVFALILSAVYGKAPRGADGGYPMGIVLVYLAFLVCMAIAYILIIAKGGFDWVTPNKITRNLLVGLGLLMAVLTAALSALFKYEPGPVPVVFRVLSGFAPAMIPLLMIAAGFVLLNSGIREATPLALYKWPLVLVFALGVLGTGTGLFIWIAAESERAASVIESNAADEARHNAAFMAEIDSCDVTKDVVRILAFTDANHDAALRAHALAKIKSNPEWQQALVYWLENKGALECFTFLASNDVDDKAMFLKPIDTGILSVVDWVRRSIRDEEHANDLYPDRFSYEVERVLRTVDKFEGLGHDYRPAVRALRAALDEPGNLAKVKFVCAGKLDAWLKQRG